MLSVPLAFPSLVLLSAGSCWRYGEMVPSSPTVADDSPGSGSDQASRFSYPSTRFPACSMGDSRLSPSWSRVTPFLEFVLLISFQKRGYTSNS